MTLDPERMKNALPVPSAEKLRPPTKGMLTPAARGQATVLRYTGPLSGTETEDAATDAITDVLHYCNRLGLDFAAIAIRAVDHVNEEIK
jgi:hypothetical protein